MTQQHDRCYSADEAPVKGELGIECFFPADEATEEALRRLAVEG